MFIIQGILVNFPLLMIGSARGFFRSILNSAQGRSLLPLGRGTATAAATSFLLGHGSLRCHGLWVTVVELLFYFAAQLVADVFLLYCAAQVIGGRGLLQFDLGGHTSWDSVGLTPVPMRDRNRVDSDTDGWFFPPKNTWQLCICP